MKRLYSLVAVLLFLIEGSFCYDFFPNMNNFCGDRAICANSELEEYLRGVSEMPTTEQELITHCPATTKYISCVITQCSKADVSNLPQIIVNSFSKNQMHMMRMQQEITTEICTVGSELRKSYLSTVGCFKVFATDYKTFQACFVESKSVYQNYTKSFENSSKKVPDQNDANCLPQVYYYQCIGDVTRERCGNDASDLVMNLLKKVGILKLFCTEDSARNFKTSFLDSLKLDEEKRDRYTSFIDSVSQETDDNVKDQAKNHSISISISLCTLIYSFIIIKYLFFW